MDIKQFEKAKRIYEKIAILDKEITELDKYAMLLANEDGEVSFEMNFKQEAEEVQPLDIESAEDIRDISSRVDSWMRDYMTNHLFWNTSSSKPKYKEDKLRETISTISALKILGILLHEKRTKRDDLINSLKKIGVFI